jgi:hypothetical protein
MRRKRSIMGTNRWLYVSWSYVNRWSLLTLRRSDPPPPPPNFEQRKSALSVSGYMTPPSTHSKLGPHFKFLHNLITERKESFLYVPLWSYRVEAQYCVIMTKQASLRHIRTEAGICWGEPHWRHRPCRSSGGQSHGFRVRAQVRSYGICGGRNGTWARFSPMNTSVSPANHPTDCSTLTIIHHPGPVQ